MRKQNSIIRILIVVFAALIALLVIGGGIYLFSASKKLKAIELSPDFTETSLEVGTQYTFTIKTSPEKASIKKATAVVDDPTSSFEISDSGKAVLTTGMNEGNVTIYVECKDIKSQVLTYSIVDSVARAQAEAAAQAEAQKKAEEEAKLAEQAEAEAAAAKKYVKCTGDDVNVRSTNSTDGEVLGKAKKGYMFEKIEDVDDWTHIVYKDKDGYMKSEFLTEISEEEYNEGPIEEEKSEDDKKKEEEKKNEGETQSKEEAEKKAAEDLAKAQEDEKKAAEELQKQQEELAAAAAALQAAAAASGHSVTMKDGVTVNFTKSQYDYLKGIWATDTDEMISHHSSGEIQSLVSGH